MTQSLNIKGLLVGAGLAVLAQFVGIALAHAGELEREDMMRSHDCEVIRLEDGGYEAQCDETAHPVEHDACLYYAEEFEDFGQPGGDLSPVYELCMVIALHTPGAVRQ